MKCSFFSLDLDREKTKTLWCWTSPNDERAQHRSREHLQKYSSPNDVRFSSWNYRFLEKAEKIDREKFQLLVEALKTWRKEIFGFRLFSRWSRLNWWKQIDISLYLFVQSLENEWMCSVPVLKHWRRTFGSIPIFNQWWVQYAIFEQGTSVSILREKDVDNQSGILLASANVLKFLEENKDEQCGVRHISYRMMLR